jgi:hypothetical protein
MNNDSKATWTSSDNKSGMPQLRRVRTSKLLHETALTTDRSLMSASQHEGAVNPADLSSDFVLQAHPKQAYRPQEASSNKVSHKER